MNLTERIIDEIFGIVQNEDQEGICVSPNYYIESAMGIEFENINDMYTYFNSLNGYVVYMNPADIEQINVVFDNVKIVPMEYCEQGKAAVIKEEDLQKISVGETDLL